MPHIVELLASAEHRYAGRPGDGASPGTDAAVDFLELRAGLGVVGDRYFNRPAHRDAAVSLMAVESLAGWDAGLVQTRRNVLLRGVDVDAGIGRTLCLDSGDGPVRLAVRRAARPCRWMDVAVGDGAWVALRGRGGVRCEPLDDGVLRVGAVDVRWLD